jgi:cytosine/adenosine deaminase-related metal-dependent hydrolase
MTILDPRPDVVLEHAQVVQHSGVERASLVIRGGKVFESAAADALRIDLADHFVFPGLVNAHDHLHVNAVPPLEHAAPFPNSYAWIDEFDVYLRDARVTAVLDVPRALRDIHGGLKNLLAGTTTVAHHDPWHPAFDDPHFPVDVLREFGWCHSLRLGEPRGTQPPRFGPSVQESFLNTPPAQPWIIHLAEGTDELAHAELASLDRLGCLAANSVLVHGVGFTDADVDRIIDRGAAVVWCPASNLAMLGATLKPHQIRRLFAAGRLALGSDSRLTGSRDLLDELRVAAQNSDLSARELFSLVSRYAAAVLRTSACGALGVGSQADCMIVRSAGDPYDTLLQTRRNSVRAVVRAGMPLVADPDFSEWFSFCGVPAALVNLDGRTKLVARHLAVREVFALEPGLEIMEIDACVS